MNNKNVLLYCTGLDEVLGDTNKVGGIQVQMMFWGETFASKGWTVFALSEGNPKTFSTTFSFIQVPTFKLISRLHLEFIREKMRSR